MPLTTSTRFVSVIESGTDWRDTSKKVLEQLEAVRTDNDGFNIGFLYVSDHLCDDLSSILNLFKSVLNIEHWCGCVAMGICGNGIEHIDKPAISVMIGHFEEDQFCVFPSSDIDDGKAEQALQPWIDKQAPFAVLTHGDPMMDANPAHTIKKLEDLVGGFVIGGLASSRSNHTCIADKITDGGLCGIAFSQDLQISCALSQGCAPIGKTHTITKCHDHTISEIDSQSALDVFENDVRQLAIQKTNIDPDALSSKGHDQLSEDHEQLFKGEVHAAFPVPGNDKGEYLVREIISIDEESRSIDVAQLSGQGDHILFVHRDSDSVKTDLSRTLCALRERVIREQGDFTPKGALYISCVARAFNDFDTQDKGGEMALVKDIIGEVPLTGFYASGEINGGRLYGYTGILILFL